MLAKFSGAGSRRHGVNLSRSSSAKGVNSPPRKTPSPKFNTCFSHIGRWCYPSLLSWGREKDENILQRCARVVLSPDAANTGYHSGTCSVKSPKPQRSCPSCSFSFFVFFCHWKPCRACKALFGNFRTEIRQQSKMTRGGQVECRQEPQVGDIPSG